MEYLGARGTLIHEKNLKSKISCQTLFKAAYEKKWVLLVNKQEPRILNSSLVSDSVSLRYNGPGNRPRAYGTKLHSLCLQCSTRISVCFLFLWFHFEGRNPSFQAPYVGRDLPLGCRSKAFRFYSTYSLHRFNKAMEINVAYLYLYYICPVSLLG
jgi:hypothetical protein